MLFAGDGYYMYACIYKEKIIYNNLSLLLSRVQILAVKSSEQLANYFYTHINISNEYREKRR